MSEEKANNQGFLVGIISGVAAAAIIGLIVVSVMLVQKPDDGDVAGANVNTNINQNTQVQAQIPSGPQAARPSNSSIATFSEKSNATICSEDGKPVVYLFSTTWCPHCVWVKDTFDSTVKKYVDSGDIVAYHWEVDTGDDTLTSSAESQVPASHMAVYQEFNPKGSIPTFVFGCKYFRVGNGHEQLNDLDAEAAEFEAVIQDLIQ